MRTPLVALLMLLTASPSTVRAADCGVLTERALESFVGKSTDAGVLLDKALDAGCDDPLLYLFQGALRRQQHQVLSAIASFRRGASRHPEHQGLGLELAISLAFHGDLSGALGQYDAMLRRTPDSVSALLGKARTLIWMERAKDSLPIYRQVLAKDEKNLEAKRGLAAALSALLRKREAAQLYHQVLAVEPQDAEARSGLRTLRAMTFGEVTLFGGVSGSASLGVSPLAGVRVTHRLLPSLQLAASYQLDTPFLYSDAPLSAGYRQRAEAGVSVKLGTRVELGVSYQFASLSQTFRHGLPLDLSVRLPRSLVLLGSARPALDQLLRLSLLASIGLQYHFLPDLWLMLQAFRYDDQDGEHATALVLSLSVPILRCWLLKLGGVYGHYRAGDTYGGFAESLFRLHPRFDLLAQYQYAAGFFEQHTATLGLRWRY